MRRAGLLALVVLVLLAGCATPLQGDSGNSTSTQDDSDGSIETYPPAVSDDGTVNETELVQQNTAAMNESVVRIDHRNGNDSTVVVRGPEAAYSRGDSGTTWSSSHTSMDNDTFGETDYSLTYQRNTTAPTRADSSMRFALVIRLSSGEYEHAGTETVDGQRLHRLEMVQPTGPGTAVEHYESTVLIDDEGRLHRLEGEVGDSEANATQFRFAFDWSVETVPEPSWGERVPRMEATRTADDTALALSVREGPSIPADTTLEFYHDGLAGDVTLSESLDSGDTLYVGYEGTPADGEVVAARQPLESDALHSLQGDQTSLDGTVTYEDGTVVSINVRVGQVDWGS